MALRILVCIASGLQAILAASLLRSGPHGGADMLVIIIAGLIGLLSQHPRYARSSIWIAAITFAAVATLLAARGAVDSVASTLWTSPGWGPQFGWMTLIFAVSAVSVTCLAMQRRRDLARA